MGRFKKYGGYELPRGIVEIVCGVCADYDRRCEVIRRGAVSIRLVGEYKRLNEAVDTGSLCIEPEIREYLIRDVAANRGYVYSLCSSYVAKNTYYLKKRKLVYEIAKKLEIFE